MPPRPITMTSKWFIGCPSSAHVPHVAATPASPRAVNVACARRRRRRSYKVHSVSQHLAGARSGELAVAKREFAIDDDVAHSLGELVGLKRRAALGEQVGIKNRH